MISSVSTSFSRCGLINRTVRRYLLVDHLPSQCSYFLVAERGKKHWNPKFRRERGAKFLTVMLPDHDEIREDGKMSVQQLRIKMKEKGIYPPRHWDEKPIHFSCTGHIFDPYVPPEGDGKISITSTPGIKQRSEEWGKKGKSYLTLRKIRDFEYDFDVPSLAEKCQEIFIEAHKALERRDEDKMHELVTEKCFPEMMDNIKRKSIRWDYIESIEIPRVVHIRHESLLNKENLFAQATVRFHSRQKLAIYDRFGRLMHGSEDTVKDVLEYVVFERHLCSLYGTWKVHGKIIPDWQPPRDPIIKTYVEKSP